uniref:ZMIZ1/ZMIZ2 GBD-like domain-containing protein n=1 Tax=Dendroctonus ponderosae TaxID=77166 RepID=A0AAR5QHI4_DENPD
MLGYTPYRDWPQGGLNTPQQLSVVTTVWGGVTTPTQSGPHGAYAGSGGPIQQQGPYLKGQPNAGYGTQANFRGHGLNNYGTGPNGMNQQDQAVGGYQNQGNALSTAAMVAAATATATATASVVALQDNAAQFANQQYNQGYQQRMMPMSGMNPMGMNAMNNMNQMGGMHAMNGMGNMGGMGPKMGMSLQGPGSAGSNAMYSNRRAVPYPNPIMHMAQKRGGQTYSNGPCPTMGSMGNPNMGNPNMGSMGPSMGPNMGSNAMNTNNFNPNSQYGGYGTRQPNFNQYPTQQSLGPTGNFGAGPGNMGPVTNPRGFEQMTKQIRGATSPFQNQAQYFTASMPQFPNNNAGQFNITNSGHSVQGQYNSSNQFQHDMALRNQQVNYQHSPIPGNPTPPLTPATSIPPYISPNPDVKPNFNDLKPPLPHKEDELRLTFPVRDGIILPPFRLEHNLAVSNHVFQLKPTVHQTLIWRSDLELQLKCFHHEDRQMNTNWPSSVQVQVTLIALNKLLFFYLEQLSENNSLGTYCPVPYELL